MIKDGGLSFETHLNIEFLPLTNGSKNAWKNPCTHIGQYLKK